MVLPGGVGSGGVPLGFPLFSTSAVYPIVPRLSAVLMIGWAEMTEFFVVGSLLPD